MLVQHDLLDIAVAAATAAADYIRTASHPTDPGAWDRKGRSDFVTHVDREAERLIAERLIRDVPDAAVMGEELSPDWPTADVVWIVDPLDGTTNYLHGYPAYAVSIAGVRRGALDVGVVLDVTRGVVYTAAAGAGARRDGEPIRVSAVREPRDALLGTGFPFKAPEVLPAYRHQFDDLLLQTSGIRRAGSAALDLADVAQGRFDGFWELRLAPWDVAAGTLLVREAGGCVSDLDGSEEVLKHGPLVAGNPDIHAWLMTRLARAASA